MFSETVSFYKSSDSYGIRCELYYSWTYWLTFKGIENLNTGLLEELFSSSKYLLLEIERDASCYLLLYQQSITPHYSPLFIRNSDLISLQSLYEWISEVLSIEFAHFSPKWWFSDLSYWSLKDCVQKCTKIL